MKKEVIVFDKDGTLMDFNSFWISVSVFALKDVLEKTEREEINIDEFLTAFGVRDGIADIDGILCKGTYEQLGMAVYDILREHGCTKTPEEIVNMVINAYKNNSFCGDIKPTCANIKEVLCTLKSIGKKLVIVTTDNYEITYKCLENLGIKEYFDAVFADDGVIPLKPDPSCILQYCDSEGITVDKAVMVGDTMTDVRFARNAGMSIIGVGAYANDRQRLKPHADMVIDDISKIFVALKELEKR